MAYEAGHFIYKQGDEISALYIATSGLAAFVQPRYKNQIFTIIDPKRHEDSNSIINDKVLMYMGFEDTVINHLLLIKDIAERKFNNEDIERRADRSYLSRRTFSVQCIYNMECMSLNYSDLEFLKKDFKTSMVSFIKQNVQQTLNVLCQLIHMITNFDKPKNKVLDFCSAYNETQKDMKERVDKIVNKFLKTNKDEAMIDIVFTDENVDSSSCEEEDVVN